MGALSKLAAILALTCAASTAFATCDDGEVVVRFSHVANTDGHPKGLAARLLQDRVNAEMDGRMCMEVFADSTLYNDDQVLEAMLLGEVQMAAPSLSKFEAFTTAFQVFDLPFLFSDIEAVDAYQRAPEGRTLLDSLQPYRLQGLAFWRNGMKQMSANVPLEMPGDAAGLTFRVQSSAVIMAQMEALGVVPRPMAFSAVRDALQAGVVDGQENTWSNIYGQKLFEMQDGVTETNHGVLDYLLVTSVRFLGGLEPATRDQFLTILREVTETRNAAATAVNEEAKQAIIEAGGVVRELTPTQRAAWVAAMAPVWDQFADRIGPEAIAAARRLSD